MDVLQDDTLEITASDATIIDEHIEAILRKVLENGQRPRDIGAAIADENRFFDLFHTTAAARLHDRWNNTRTTSSDKLFCFSRSFAFSRYASLRTFEWRFNFRRRIVPQNCNQRSLATGLLRTTHYPQPTFHCYNTFMPQTLLSLVEFTAARLICDGGVEIARVASIGQAQPGDLIFVQDEKYLEE